MSNAEKNNYDFLKYYYFARDLRIHSDIMEQQGFDTETLCRNAISRGYYAAYHVALRFLPGQKGFQLSDYESHGQVIRDLRKRNPHASRMLDRLRAFREKADYKSEYLSAVEDIDDHIARVEACLRSLRVAIPHH